MAANDINQVLADNLRHHMNRLGLTQQGVADRCNVSQRTISNYLNPSKREAGTSGKAGSAKLTEVQMLANSLGVQVWEMLRHYAPGEREAYQAIETAFLQLRASATPTLEEVAHPANRKAA